MPAPDPLTRSVSWNTFNAEFRSDLLPVEISEFGRMVFLLNVGFVRSLILLCPFRLTSPSGTQSVLLFERPRDVLDSSFDDWPFMSVHFWGERASGRWKLEILNAGVKRVNKAGKIPRLHLIESYNRFDCFDPRNIEKVATCVLWDGYESHSFTFASNTASHIS